MTVNAKIRTVDYNNIRNQVNNVLGVGLGNTGYGQTSLVTSTTVSESNKVSIIEWNRLKADITTCWNHIYNANPPSIATAVQNATVRSNATNSPYTQYQTFASSIITDRFTTPANNIVSAKGSATQTWPGIFGQTWKTTLESIVTVSWSSANAARFFFNSGGQIRFSSSRSGGTTTGGAGTIAAQNNEWTRFLTDDVGTRSFGGNIPEQGTGALTGRNFYRLSNIYTNPWYSSTAGGAYGLSTFRIWARSVDVSNNSSGGATTIEFLVQWIDDHVSVGGGPDGVDGTLTLNVSELRAAGAFTIESATVNIGRIQPANAPANTTYTVTPNFTSLNEGATVNFTVNTTNVPNGTQLYWTLAGGPGFTAADFSDGLGSGSFFINNNTGSFTRQLASDYVTEGTEFFVIEIRINGITGQIVSTSNVISVNDTTITYLVSVNSNYTTTQTLRSLATAAGWNGTQRLQVTFEPSRSMIGSINALYNGSDNPVKHRDVGALVVEGNFPNGLILINKGHITGRGGIGGAGGIGGNGSPGQAGSPGLVITSTFSAPFFQLWNYGAVTGGGGGGGGGGYMSAGLDPPAGGTRAPGSSNGGGGGGAAGVGAGGLGPPNGLAGTFYVSGDGGDPDGGYSKGGRGGNLGEAGGSGTGNRPGRAASSGGAGGVAGYSIIGLSSVTIVVPGTRTGPDLSSTSNN